MWCLLLNIVALWLQICLECFKICLISLHDWFDISPFYSLFTHQWTLLAYQFNDFKVHVDECDPVIHSILIWVINCGRHSLSPAFLYRVGLVSEWGVTRNISMNVTCVCVCARLSLGRSISQERSSASSWTELMAHPHKHKELANYCSLLQEHYYQSYVKGHIHTYIHDFAWDFA